MLENVTVFDFETTGLNPEKDRVIEMAAIRVVNGQIISEFSSLVKQNMTGGLPEKITEITGITTEAMMTGLDEISAFKILNRFIGDSLIVAHNAAFDLSFLHFTLQRIAGRTFENKFIDTLTISRDRHFYPHKLTDMCQRYGIVLDGAHRALNDVRGCWELLKSFHTEDPVDEYVNRLGYLNKYGAPKWAPDYAELVGVDNRYDNAM